MLMNKMAIITYADNKYEENLEMDFLRTLFKVSKYDGYVYILNYGISSKVKERILENYPVRIVDCIPSESIFTSRYRDICDLMDDLPQNVDYVITMDSGDIWFQDSIKSLDVSGEFFLSLSEENRIWGEDEWTNKCLNNLDDEKKKSILEKIAGKTVKNSGVIVADKITMKKLANSVYEDICEYGYEFFGIDQIFVNYEVSKLFESNYQILSDVYNYVVISNQGKYISQNDVLYKVTGEKIVVVHNAGGNWRIIQRDFVNKFVDEQQYVIENIYKIEKK